MKKILILILTFFSISPAKKEEYKLRGKDMLDTLALSSAIAGLSIMSYHLFFNTSNKQVKEIEDKLKKLNLPTDLKKEVDSELKNLKNFDRNTSEHANALNYFNTIFSIPWEKYTKDNLDLNHAQSILDSEHFGLEEIKDRILDFLAVQSLKPMSHAPVLCFVGPPGIGKTTFAKSIALCLGRNSFIISAAGMHYESEIRGHNRCYIKASPGRFVSALQRAESMNPLIIIDEIDKLGRNSNQGDPSAALLEILDPKQNIAFFDNYIHAGIDFSKVIFIATANNLNDIPEALRDRMEIIKLSGYTREEKIEIAERHLIKRALENVGIEGKNFTLSRDLIAHIIDHYAPEPGVRKLQRLIEKLCSKAVRSFAQGKAEITFSLEDVSRYLGPQKI